METKTRSTVQEVVPAWLLRLAGSLQTLVFLNKEGVEDYEDESCFDDIIQRVEWSLDELKRAAGRR